MQLKKHTTSGFSLIEIMVSVAIFSVVVMAGTLAVLSIIDANQKSDAADQANKLASDWLDANYPDWRNPGAYWD